MKSNIIVPNTYKITKTVNFCSICDNGDKKDKKDKEDKKNKQLEIGKEVEIKKGQLETFIDPTAKISRDI